MQGLVHYSDDSSPEPQHPAGASAAGPSRLRRHISTASPASSATASGHKAIPRVNMKSTTKSSAPSGVIRPPASSSSDTSASKPPKRPRQSSPHRSAMVSESHARSNLPGNLTHTAQSDMYKSELAGASSITGNGTGGSPFGPAYEGMTPEQVFRAVTRPAEKEGVDDWGIPPAVDPAEASDQLKAKVDNFLRLKYERGEHINSRLLSSSAFANPHIYSKLVEFVSIDERATAFPSSASSPGWLTRHNLESLIPTYGPHALSTAQKAKEEATKAAQAAGKRTEIKFAPSKYVEERNGKGRREKDRERERNGAGWDRDRDRDRVRDRDRERERDYRRGRK